MNPIIMEAFLALLKTFVDGVRKKGLVVIMLALCMVALGVVVINLDSRVEQHGRQWQTRLDTVNRQWSAALNVANARILECERDKYDLSYRVAVLEFQLGLKKNKKR